MTRQDRIEPKITHLTGQSLGRPVWHILRVLSGSEFRVADRLALAGIHTCFPTETRTWRDGQGRQREREVATVAGFIFAKFRHAPQWHIMRTRRIITGLVCRDTQWGPVPYSATEDDVRLFMRLPTVSEEMEAMRREALRVKPGDHARVLLGRDTELAVIVTDVDGDRVFWECGLLRGETTHERCEKTGVDDAA